MNDDSSGMKAAIERRVRDVWARVEAEKPERGGLIYALIPVARTCQLGDIPFLPECVRLEVELPSCDLPDVIGLKFVRRAEV